MAIVYIHWREVIHHTTECDVPLENLERILSLCEIHDREELGVIIEDILMHSDIFDSFTETLNYEDIEDISIEDLEELIEHFSYLIVPEECVSDESTERICENCKSTFNKRDNYIYCPYCSTALNYET